jgi:predicted aconitase
MVQSDSSGDAGLTFAKAIKDAAARTRLGTTQQPPGADALAQLTAQQGRFGTKTDQELLGTAAPEEGGEPPAPSQEAAD